MNSEIPQVLYKKTLEQMVMVYVNSLLQNFFEMGLDKSKIMFKISNRLRS